MPPSGSSTSPFPVSTSSASLSATIISASRLRKYLSVRQSLASSTAARSNWPRYCSSLRSSRSNRVKASAVAPANPAITCPSSPRRRTFFALGFITVLPIETWPSPAMTVLPPFFTPMMVVPCHWMRPWLACRSSMPRIWASGRSASILRRAQGSSAAPASRGTGANLADVAEQILEKAAVAAERRGLVVLGVDPRDLLHAGALDVDDVVGRVEVHGEHRLPGDLGRARRSLRGRARHVVPHWLAELADEAGAAERALDRLAVVDARLDRLQQDLVGEVAAMSRDLDATGRQQRRAEHRPDPHPSRHSQSSRLRALAVCQVRARSYIGGEP